MPAHSRPARHPVRWSWLAALAAVAALVLVVRPAIGRPHRADAGPPPAAAATARPSASPTVRPQLRPRAKATPRTTPTPRVTAIPDAASGVLAVVPGRVAPSGPGTVLTYRLEVERGLPLDREAVADQVQRVLTDPRGWQPIEGVAFSRVDVAASFDLVIASPTLTDRLCYPLDTVGELSCRNGNRVILNARRWATAVPWYGGRLDDYRAYLVNHEVGHRLGHGHAMCPRTGAPAPVMMQQTKGIGACRPNPWPSVAV